MSSPISEVASCDAYSTAVWTINRSASPSECIVLQPLSNKSLLVLGLGKKVFSFIFRSIASIKFASAPTTPLFAALILIVVLHSEARTNCN